MIYLDHAAATPVSKAALSAMLPFFSDNFFNPSAAYLPAHHVREAYATAKATIANFIGAKSADLVITSGATEANSLALSAVENFQHAKLLVLETEHASVLENAKKYPFETIKVDRTGLVDLADLAKKLTDDVILVSISLANNELGTIQPLSDIAALLRDVKMKRLKTSNPLPLYLHSDASQGLALLDFNVSRLGVDLLTLNSAKIGGPKGVGALYVSRDVILKPSLLGGGQESNLRSGTENVAGVIGFAAALAPLKNKAASNRKKYEKLRHILKTELETAIVPPLFLGSEKHHLANFLPVSFPGLDAERLIYRLEEKEIYVSTGAACAASKNQPSHVLKAIGLSELEIKGSLRLTLGSLNNEDNVRLAGQIIRETIDKTVAERAPRLPKTPPTSPEAAAAPMPTVKTSTAPLVFLGMSGGVDSSVSAVLLQNQGYRVVGVYMKNWSRDLPGMKCPWAEDLADAKRVAVKLGLDFRVFDFETAYKEKVVDAMLSDFRAGRTPNPDVLCNEEIKFKLFYETAMANGADFIATGHYAKSDHGELKLAEDMNKDQTYFLYRISKAAVEHTLFPLADLEKPEVKALAKTYGLANAHKKESMGVCFVGEVGIKDFLKAYLPTQPGEIRELETDAVLGNHDGAIFYTLGQRHGLYIGGGLPYYVVKKDLKNNLLYVSKNLNIKNLWTQELQLENLFFREPTSTLGRFRHDPHLFVRLRHRAPLLPARIELCSATTESGAKTAVLTFSEEIKRPAPGQSAVFYTGSTPGSVCLGGGIIR